MSTSDLFFTQSYLILSEADHDNSSFVVIRNLKQIKLLTRKTLTADSDRFLSYLFTNNISSTQLEELICQTRRSKEKSRDYQDQHEETPTRQL